MHIPATHPEIKASMPGTGLGLCIQMYRMAQRVSSNHGKGSFMEKERRKVLIYFFNIHNAKILIL